MERGTVEWNGGTVEWNSGMVERWNGGLRLTTPYHIHLFSSEHSATVLILLPELQGREGLSEE